MPLPRFAKHLNVIPLECVFSCKFNFQEHVSGFQHHLDPRSTLHITTNFSILLSPNWSPPDKVERSAPFRCWIRARTSPLTIGEAQFLDFQHLLFPLLRVLEYFAHAPTVIIPCTAIDHMVPFLVSSDEGLDPRQYTFRSLPPFVHTYGPISEGPLIFSLPSSRYRVCPDISIRTRSYSIATSEDPLHVLRYICNADYF